MTAYDYGNARLRGMKSRLLPRSQLESLAESGSVPTLVAALTRTPYQAAVDTALARGQGYPAVAWALNLSLQESVGLLSRFYHGRAWQLLLFALRRYDVHNLRSVLRGLSKNADPEAIANTWMPPAELSEANLFNLARTGDLRAAIDRMATMRLPQARPLLQLRQTYPGFDLLDMELALLRWYHQEADRGYERERQLPDSLVKYLDWQADVDNLLAILRFAHAPDDRKDLATRRYNNRLEDLLPAPGKLSLRLLIQAGETDSVEAAVGLLASTPYGQALAAGYRAYRESGRLSDLERQLVRTLLGRQASLIRNDPLGIGVPLGFMSLKINEIANLRWVARGVQIGLPAAEIKVGML
jgi:V/A-type H+-transporting ATPase subunit C